MAAVTSVVLYETRDTSVEVKTITGFLTGYSGRTFGCSTGGARPPALPCSRSPAQGLHVKWASVERSL